MLKVLYLKALYLFLLACSQTLRATDHRSNVRQQLSIFTVSGSFKTVNRGVFDKTLNMIKPFFIKVNLTSLTYGHINFGS